ncbi:uncharacterized protein FOMMEDRAFT_113492 [Fomitiporia mediterranea MF3/22]|uniref:uncharacterized protein n=1 Tax=Fomitiporia mediterranea (strain MF3/22) TaxID=694068 RepID=UPI000440765A|nr:uncharacterized protein FOMMEDRAFT_113492 [Fomitiporia mediterranea MF3/22]EJC98913.1 hypothetical protein FOMMEDRAFT_113492 [Fomitiporia mediterranea MF3/22]
MSGQFSRSVISLASSATHLHRRAAEQQGGLLSGVDPTQFTSADPIRLWIVQVGIIVLTAQLLSVGLKRLKEPKVISEVLGGILLGPTAFGRIPGFTQHIFPAESIPYLSLVANIGLVLFLFLVGLEIETAVIKKNARYSMPIALAGMVLPFGLGAALALPIYHRYINEDEVSYTHFMLFTGVAFSITAFPVLCRILTELKLIDTTVGIVVLSAGVGNDIIGWTLLALSVALVNAASGLSALWILLTAVAWTLFLLIPVKRAFKWFAQRTGSIENGPTMSFMTATILMTFASAFFTDIIGVHAIFGGFLAGLVVPREGGLAILLTEKLEDMVSIIFLPLYFTLSGLSTNLGLLDDGITWGYTIAICCLAYFGKFGGCSVAAKLCGFKWREASTIGSLMSCKGLVELIVLNIGLNAGILTQRVFSMFVFEALVLTCLTTPVVQVLYPPSRRTRAVVAGPDYLATGEENGPVVRPSTEKGDDVWKTRFTVVLDSLEHLPGMMALTQLIHPPPGGYDNEKEREKEEEGLERRGSSSGSSISRRPGAKSNVVIDALRLIELSDRTSAVMKSTSMAEHLIHTDPLLNVFKTFGELNDLSISSSISVVTFSDLASRVADRARDLGSQLVLVPWLPPSAPMATSPTEAPPTPAAPVTPFLNPFDMLFRTQTSEKSASVVHSHFIRAVFAQCQTDVALYVDRTMPSSSDYFGVTPTTDVHSNRFGSKHHILLPFFGGPDDRLALEFVVQLCANRKISATVVRMTKSETGAEVTRTGEELVGRPEPVHSHSFVHRHGHDHGGNTTGEEDKDAAAAAANIRANAVTIGSMTGIPDTVYGAFTTQTRLQSETADSLVWARYASPSPTSEPLPERVTDALQRVSFREQVSPTPLHSLIDVVTSQLTRANSHGRRLVVVLGRSRRLAVEDHTKELRKLVEEMHGGGSVGGEVRKTIGDVASALVVSGCDVGIVVMQAANRSVEA